MNSTTTCSDCQNKDKEKLTKATGMAWLCDDCFAKRERDAITVNWLNRTQTLLPQHAKIVDTK